MIQPLFKDGKQIAGMKVERLISPSMEERILQHSHSQ
jgi:hypothetical protein